VDAAFAVTPKIGVLIVALRLRPAYGSGGDPSTPRSISDDIGCAQSGHTPINPGKFACCMRRACRRLRAPSGWKKIESLRFFMSKALFGPLFDLSNFWTCQFNAGRGTGFRRYTKLNSPGEDVFDLGWVPFLAASLEPKQFSDGRERALFERVAPVGAPRSR
jgi:hypothetical protein